MQAKILGLCICTLTYFVINSTYLINYKHKQVEVKIAHI